MKTLIIEDERIAAENLQRMISQHTPQLEVCGILQSVEEAVEYFTHSDPPDLVFMDIHLADGLAFHIFDSVTIHCPIIFTTAYDQYALQAFQVNSIDYLLKPISPDDLKRAINKLEQLTSTNAESSSDSSISPQVIASMMEMVQPNKYKSFFLLPLRDKLVPLAIDQIAFIYVDEKLTRAVSFDGKSYAIDKPLDNIFSQLNPARFFRANRQYIIAHSAIKDISIWPLSKLHITLSVPTPDKIIIPRARAAEFKDWYTN